MPNYDDNPSTDVTGSSKGSTYFILGLLVAALLVGAYVLIGAPGLHTQVAYAPANGSNGQQTDATAPRPANP
jgi:hypothetical protein